MEQAGAALAVVLQMKFSPVRTVADLESLSEADILEGYMSAELGDPEPGENRGRAFWHGWRCRMMDLGEIKDPEHHKLVREWVACQSAARINK